MLGKVNKADYYSKHHTSAHHQRQRKNYVANTVHTFKECSEKITRLNSLGKIRSLRGCVDNDTGLNIDAH